MASRSDQDQFNDGLVADRGEAVEWGSLGCSQAGDGLHTYQWGCPIGYSPSRRGVGDDQVRAGAPEFIVL